jgi:hypothetical protein
MRADTTKGITAVATRRITILRSNRFTGRPPGPPGSAGSGSARIARLCRCGG